MAGKPGTEADAGSPILRCHLGSNPYWTISKFLAHRSREGSVLGRDLEWSSGRAAHGSDRDDGFQSKSNGKVCDPALPEIRGLARDWRHGVRLRGRVVYMEIGPDGSRSSVEFRIILGVVLAVGEADPVEMFVRE